MRALFAIRFGLACLVAALFYCAPVHPAGAQNTNKTRMNHKDGATMVLIPAGPFSMGDDFQKDNPPHKVILSAYYIYKNPVTVGQYKKFCKATNRKMPAAPSFNPNWSKTDHPMVNVSWNDAKAYCDWAGVRLPTEAQWEKAARGTDGRRFPWGSAFDTSKLWCSKSQEGDAGGTTSVGHYTDSPYGLSDMAGNVWQWCSDWYNEAFWFDRNAAMPDPENKTPAQRRELRGGSWSDHYEGDFFCSHRGGAAPNGRDAASIGFRCASPANSH